MFFEIEFLAVIFSLVCVYYTVVKNILSWPIGLIGITLYGIIFFNARLFADFGLQFIFFFQGLYGWYNWVKNKDKLTKELKTTYLSKIDKLKYLFLILITYIVIASILSSYTNSSVPYVDSFVSTLSLYANWLLAKRKIDNWYLWIVADIIYIGLFWYKKLYMSSCLYLVFLIMATYGLINWIKRNKILDEKI